MAKKSDKAAELSKKELRKAEEKAKKRAKKAKKAEKATKAAKAEKAATTPKPPAAEPAVGTPVEAPLTLGSPTADWSVVALRVRAREVGLQGYSRMTKAQLLDKLG